MQNTIENKAKFFALYWGQEILYVDSYNKIKHIDSFWLDELINESHLLLTPLSQISDEDAIEVAKILGNAENGSSIEWDCGGESFDFIGDYCGTVYYDGEIDYNENEQVSLLILQAYDYLRSKGYALPYMGLSVDKLIEYGWVKLKA